MAPKSGEKRPLTEHLIKVHGLNSRVWECMGLRARKRIHSDDHANYSEDIPLQHSHEDKNDG